MPLRPPQDQGPCPAVQRLCIALRSLRRKRWQAPYRQMFRRQVERVHYINTARHAHPLVERYALGKALRRKIWAILQEIIPTQAFQRLRTARRTEIPHSQLRKAAAGTPYRQRQGGRRPRQPQDQRHKPERRRLPAWCKMQGKAAQSPAILWAARQICQTQEMPRFFTLAEIRQTARFCVPIQRISGAMPLPAKRRRVQARRTAQIEQKIPRTAKAFLSGRAKPPADRPCRTGRRPQERRALTRKTQAMRDHPSMVAGLCGRTAQQRAGRAALMFCGKMGGVRKAPKRRNVC